MRAFVTGGHGFVGSWLRGHLEDCGDVVVAPDERLDVMDRPALTEAVAKAGPDAVYHLAALTHVVESWGAPADFMRTNAIGTMNVLEAARECSLAPRVLVVSSSEAYGKVSRDQLPLGESSPLRPVSPYAVSKVAAEFVGLQAFLGYGLHTVIVRPFNHVGPGQAPSFAVSAIARRIVVAQRDGDPVVKVGDLSARRDFTDVRDVVRAYRMLIERGEPGQVYNVCSGHDVAISHIADTLKRLAGADVTFETDTAFTRPGDLPVLTGDPTRVRAATGWEPVLPLEQTLGDVLEHWRKDLVPSG